MKIYFPVSARIITPGHIKCLEWLRDYKKQIHPLIVVGLLTDEAMKGYKEPIVSFKDRKYILDAIANGIRDKFDMHCVFIFPQDKLDPTENIKKHKCVAIASGDGWEDIELKAIKRFKLIKINIGLPKKYSSSNIIKKVSSLKRRTKR